MKWIIFFDLDDTLIDTSERHYRVYKDIIEDYGMLNIVSKEEFWSYKRTGGKTEGLISKNSSKEFIQKFMDEWLKRIEDKNYLKYDNLVPESPKVLSVLRNKADLILVTLRNSRKNLFWELDRLGLNNYFSQVLVGSPVKLKNKTKLIKDYIENNMGETKFIIIGDTEVDIFTGKELGMLTIAVNYGIRSREFLENLKPDFNLDKLSVLPEILEIGGEE
jgi:phosphoglycolate phosphatase-like HAD superfamily hydrolase